MNYQSTFTRHLVVASAKFVEVKKNITKSSLCSCVVQRVGFEPTNPYRIGS
jgi:hypothetical protein